MAVCTITSVGWHLPLKSASGPGESILKEIDLVVEAGEWVAISGNSGGGKTTLLSMAGGLLSPTEGAIALFGRPTKNLSEAELATIRNQKIGFVFQNYHLDDTRSALENILLPGYFSQRTWFELKAKARDLAARLELTNHLQKDVSVLSGGQRQRVAVARGLLLEPSFLLADEPTGALDQHTADLVLDLFSHEHQKGTSFLTVTHDSRLLERCDRHLELVDGLLQSVSPPSAKGGTSP